MRIDPRIVPCPYCKATPNQSCSEGGLIVMGSHFSRHHDALLFKRLGLKRNAAGKLYQGEEDARG